MDSLFGLLKAKVKNTGIKIVFPEGTDERIIKAAGRLASEKAISPQLLGNKDQIMMKADSLKVDLRDVEILDPKTNPMIEEMIPVFIEKRKGKVTEEEARKILQDETYFGTMLVEINYAQGLVSGAVHTTADTVRPALQIIKTKPGVKKTSGVFIIFKDNDRFIFGDCAINVNPTSEDLAEIAIESAKTAKLFGIEPRVAMLSFSSHGSAVTEESKKVLDATNLVKQMEPSLVVDGEIQFDAAVVPEVAKQKVPNSPLQGVATVFVFPNLDSGNIGYKIAQRFGKFEAVGPVLQGLNKPVNDLSRGCNEDDVYYLSLITASQAIEDIQSVVI